MNTPLNPYSNPALIQHPLLLIDGVCNLCDGAVRFLIKKDKSQKLRYGSLQSEKGSQAALARGILVKTPPESMILISDGKVYLKSEAWLELFKILGGPWKAMLIFKIFPAGFRDFFYDWIAKNRYRWFGKKEFCAIPSPEIKNLFID